MYDHFRLLLESKQLKAKRTKNCLEYNDDDYEEQKDDSKFWTVDYDDRPKNVSFALKYVPQYRLIYAYTLINIHLRIRIHIRFS